LKKFLILLLALIATPALAQNTASTSIIRVQGAPAGIGAPVQVVVRGDNAIWRYANGATGILSNTTTAVTIKTAAGAGVRNYVTGCQINTTAFGAAAVLVIRDGAGGTVIWANTVPTAGWLTPVNLIFDTPLRGTANTLLEVATATANTSGTAFVNCQGYTGP
jgi:uncharacterized protein (UPF0333 family)